MSAYICEPELFKSLALFATRKEHGSLYVDPRYLRHPAWKPLFDQQSERSHMPVIDDRAGLASVYADVLYRENIRSVSHRYPNDTYEELPGPIVKPLRMVVTVRDMIGKLDGVKAVHMLKMCNCLSYQCCETDDWEQTAAYELIQIIIGAAIRALPGYELAPWGYAA